MYQHNGTFGVDSCGELALKPPSPIFGVLTFVLAKVTGE